MKYNKIILHIPHSSDRFPSEEDRRKWRSLDGLRKDMEKWTDWGTDRMFDSGMDGIESVAFGYSRFYCDAERLVDDSMESIGQGIVYTRFEENTRDVSEDDRMVIMGIYRRHIEELKGKLSEGCLLVDCHSFPEELSDVDICIGLNDDWSRPDDETVRSVIEYFESAGLKVGINTPFANSVSPKVEGIGYDSMMIEVNKRLYMSDGKVEYERLMEMRELMKGLYSELKG